MIKSFSLCRSREYFRFLVLACLLAFLAACGGGGGNTVATVVVPALGSLSIEEAKFSATTAGSGTLTLLYIDAASASGTAEVTVSADNADFIAIPQPAQTATSRQQLPFQFTFKEFPTDTRVQFSAKSRAILNGAPSDSSVMTTQGSVTVPGTGLLSVSVTPPAAGASTGTVTALFAGGVKAMGWKVGLTSDNATLVTISPAEGLADSSGKVLFSYQVGAVTQDTPITFTAASSAQSVQGTVTIPAPAPLHPTAGG